MSASKFQFVGTYPPSPGYGPGLAVKVRESGLLIGYVRKIIEPQSPGSNWLVYAADGSELGVSDLRSTAANWLMREVSQ